VRTALIVAVTIPFALLFSFICLDWRHIPANLLSIAPSISASSWMLGGDGGEYLPRTGGTGRPAVRLAGRDPRRGERRGAADLLRHRGDHRGYLPIYVLTGPSGRLFQPMADTMSFALWARCCARSRCCRCCAPIFCASMCTTRSAILRAASAACTAGLLGWCLRNRLLPRSGFTGDLRKLAHADSVHWRGIHAAPGRRRPVGARHHRTPYPSTRRPSCRRRSAIS